MPNTLVFVDMPTPDPVAATKFYEEVFGWTINPRPLGEFHQVVPGEGLHLGIFSESIQSPDPAPTPVEGRTRNQPRVYILVEDDVDSFVDAAVARGGKELWRKAWWDEFEGYHASFLDPWGNQIVMWHKDDAPAT